MRPSEPIGTLLGAALAPVVAIAALFRRARVFHPTGWCYAGSVQPLADEGALGAVAARLTGAALVRMSTGKFKDIGRRPDVFGCAIRFCDDASATPGARDQDLLMASFESLKRAEAGIRSTDVNDFLRNTYYAITEYQDPDLGAVRWRIVPQPVDAGGDGAVERLDKAIERGVTLTLEVSTSKGDWKAVCAIALTERVDIDQRQLRFTPFRTGRGIEPRGLLNAVRRLAYPAGQLGRR